MSGKKVTLAVICRMIAAISLFISFSDLFMLLPPWHAAAHLLMKSHNKKLNKGKRPNSNTPVWPNFIFCFNIKLPPLDGFIGTGVSYHQDEALQFPA